MKQIFSSRIIAASSLTFGLSIVQYNGITDLYRRIEDKSVETDVRRVQTGRLDGVFNEVNYALTMNVLNTKYRDAYRCQSGIDKNGCRVSSKR